MPPGAATEASATASRGIRLPALAGLFYPDNPARLGAEIDAWLDKVSLQIGRPKAVVAPHAGYAYSGPVAASAYGQVRALRGTVTRVVLLGPCHRVPVPGLAVPSAETFRTPLGDIPLDREAIARLSALPFVETNDPAHAQEHALEVHLPFLQRVLGDFSLVPIVVGAAAPERVDRALADLWGGPETLIVVSSDLSHYHDYETARRLDDSASSAIETLSWDTLLDGHACGRHALRGLLRRARALDLRPTTLDLRNSGDTAGDKARVVGYGAWMFEYAAEARLPDAHRETLVRIARHAILNSVGKPGPQLRIEGVNRPLATARASFVTVRLDGALRGCVGSVTATRPLVVDVAENAYKAAFGDPRFPPVTKEEAERLEIHVSILSSLRRIPARDEAELLDALRPDVDGLVLVEGERRALYLPEVWHSLPQARDFLSRLKEKAGLPPDHWSPELKVYRFSTERF